MLEHLDIWRLLAGLGIFLFGIFLMEESIKLLSGRAFKSLIRRYTDSRLKGIMTGTISTAVLQSSSAVSLMVLAFTGAGLMSLVNAIAVMMGTKIGTTMTAWIVAVFGFKFEIESFALLMIGIGGLGLIFLANSARYVNISKLFVAFGFLFLGLDYMKGSVEDLAAAFDLESLPDLGLWFYVLTGLVLTAIMQSSSATIAIVLTVLFTGVISFNAAAAMVIGANIGTTVTVILGSLGGIPVKKQAALSQLIFTVGTGIVAFLMLPLLTWLVLEVFRFSENPVLGVALFHTMFNVIGVLLFFPLIPAIAKFAESKFDIETIHFSEYITKTSAEVPEAALEALRKEVLNQLAVSMAYVRRLYNIDKPLKGVKYADYSAIERYHAEIFSFYAKIQEVEVTEEETRILEKTIRSSRSIMNATKNMFDQREEIETYSREDNEFILQAEKLFRERIINLSNVAVLMESEPDIDHSGMLNHLYFNVEEDDKKFIRSCSGAISAKKIKEEEVTDLLMTNRVFTQSCRMLVLSMRNLSVESSE
jgi:phosphate:Na+ symporter